MKKIIFTTLVVLLLTGCQQGKITNESIEAEIKEEEKEVVVTTESGSETIDETTDEEQYNMIGVIESIVSGRVTIIAGCIANDYEIGVEAASQFFIGETVEVFEEETVILKSFMEDKSGNRYTSMGILIEEVSGEVLSVDENSISILVDEETIKFEVTELPAANLGDQVTIDYFQRADEKYFMTLYNDSHKIKSKIISMERNDDGYLILNCGNENIEYVLTLDHAVTNFNLSELKVDDAIEIYAEVFLLSYPAQMAPKKVYLTSSL